MLTAVENGGAGLVSWRSKMTAHNRAVLEAGWPGRWHFGSGLPADERLVCLGGSGLGVRRGFPFRNHVSR